MKITDAPTPIATPFAQKGTRNDIPDNDPGFTGDATGRAAFTTGFPDITMRPITAGGVPPFGADFNGILYALSNAVRFYGAGGHYKFNADFAAKIGGYPMGATVQATDNMGHWLNVVESNSIDPESGLSTGWLPLADHNGTATVALTASAALTPLQAAKANIRFIGTPTGNVTVTFPAWTKRYSIINDCAGDGTIICTTGNGESISIKNGAKYEVGCDGKNLTVATVNASQVFAEPNKNISALDAPTVQQLLNALGSAAKAGIVDINFWDDEIPRSRTDTISANTAKIIQDNIDFIHEATSAIFFKKVLYGTNVNEISDSGDYLISEKTAKAIVDYIKSSISNLGAAAKAGLLNIESIDDDEIPRSRTDTITANTARLLQDNVLFLIDKLKALFGKQVLYTDDPSSIGDSGNYLIPDSTLKHVVDYMNSISNKFSDFVERRRMPGEIDSVVFAQNMNIEGFGIQYQRIYSGASLLPCSADGDGGEQIDKDIRLPGQWIACGQAERSSTQSVRGRRATMFMRVS